MVLHSKLTDPMDPKILPVSYKDKLVGLDEKKVSDEKKDKNIPSFDGLKDVDSFASSEATLTEEYLEMYAQNSGVYAHARSSSSSKEPTEFEEDDTKSHQSTPSKKFIIVNTSTGATGKSLARKKKKEQRAKNKKEKRIYIYVSPKMRTVPVRELGSQFAN